MDNNPFKAIQDELAELAKAVQDEKEAALEEATSMVVDKLKQATPENTGRTRAAWEKQLKYNGVKFVYNTALSPQNIPIVNLLEYSFKGRPFAIKTFNNCVTNIEAILEKHMKKIQ